MSTLQRITLSIPADVVEQARAASQGNLSQFVSTILRDHFEHERRHQLREALKEAAIAKAAEDLETAAAFRYAEDEAVALYVPPYIVDEPAGQAEPVLAEQEH